MSSIYRFYKQNANTIESLRQTYIFLFSPKKWEEDGEYDFKIDTGTDEEYKMFIKKCLNEYYQLVPSDPEYQKFRSLVKEKLNGKDIYLNNEYNILLDILFEESKKEEGIEIRKKLIKELFFESTGISCFTSDLSTLESYLHWERFSNYGVGFCIEYDREILEKYFIEKGIVIDSIKYYSDDYPILKRNDDLEFKKENYHEIFFSLKQSLYDEKEIRMGKIFQYPLTQKDNKRKQEIPKESIVSITIGYNMDPVELRDLVEIIKQELCHAKIFKITEQHGNLFRIKCADTTL